MAVASNHFIWPGSGHEWSFILFPLKHPTQTVTQTTSRTAFIIVIFERVKFHTQISEIILTDEEIFTGKKSSWEHL